MCRLSRDAADSAAPCIVKAGYTQRSVEQPAHPDSTGAPLQRRMLPGEHAELGEEMLISRRSYGWHWPFVSQHGTSSSSSAPPPAVPLPVQVVTAAPSSFDALGDAAVRGASGPSLDAIADLFFHVLCFFRAADLLRLLASSREDELRVRLLLPALVERRGWGGEQDLCANPLSTLHLSELWDLLADVSSPIGVHYMLLRHTLLGTSLELQLSKGASLARFGFCAADDAEAMWCRGSFVVKGALQCRKWTDELRRCPQRMPITQSNVAKQSSFTLEHCGDRFVLRPANVGEVRPQLQLTSRGFIAIATEGGGIIVEDGLPARRIEPDAAEDTAC